MAIQVSVPFMIPEISNHFIHTQIANPTMKMGGIISNVGSALNKRIQLCGQIVAQLERDGWKVQGFANGCWAQHSDIATEDQAELRLKSIGIDPKNVIISSTWDDWFAHNNPVLDLQSSKQIPQYA